MNDKRLAFGSLGDYSYISHVASNMIIMRLPIQSVFNISSKELAKFCFSNTLSIVVPIFVGITFLLVHTME